MPRPYLSILLATLFSLCLGCPQAGVLEWRASEVVSVDDMTPAGPVQVGCVPYEGSTFGQFGVPLEDSSRTELARTECVMGRPGAFIRVEAQHNPRDIVHFYASSDEGDCCGYLPLELSTLASGGGGSIGGDNSTSFTNIVVTRNDECVPSRPVEFPPCE